MDQPVAPVLIIGCGNLLRGDDAVGPLVIRTLWEMWGEWVPAGVELCDGGTAGMDVAFKMRGRSRVILIDACDLGCDPGALYCVPGDELENIPDLTTLHSHSFRWDHALAFARWLLKESYPQQIQVYLIQIEKTDFGAPLSKPVEDAMGRLVKRIVNSLTEEGFED